MACIERDDMRTTPVLLALAVLAGCGTTNYITAAPTPSPTPSPVPIPTPTPSPAPTPLNYLDVWEPVAVGISDTQAAPTDLTPCPATLTAKDGRTVACASGDYIDTRENVTFKESRGGTAITGFLGISNVNAWFKYNLGGVVREENCGSSYSADYQTWTATYTDIDTGFKTVKQWRRKK